MMSIVARPRVERGWILRNTSQHSGARECQDWINGTGGLVDLRFGDFAVVQITIQERDGRCTLMFGITLRFEIKEVFYRCFNATLLRSIGGVVEVHLQDF